MARASVLEAFGNGFYGLYEENHGLSSVVSYPDRGPWGNARYRGNCTGHLVKDLVLRFKSESVFDPMEGGGTVRDVVHGINQHLRRTIHYEGRDLRQGWDVLESPLPHGRFDMVWLHPPYWDIIRYSESEKDMSRRPTMEDFEKCLREAVARLSRVLACRGVLAVLIGDKRRSGEYFPLLRCLLTDDLPVKLKGIIVKVQHNCRSDRIQYSGKNPFFIPIRHEYCLLFEKREA